MKVFKSSDGIFKFSGSKGTVIPSGPTSERPTSPEVGTVRFNTAAGSIEVYDGSTWLTMANTAGSSVYLSKTGDSMTGQLGIIQGSQTNPGIYFTSDTDTGIFLGGPNTASITTAGSEKFAVSQNKIYLGQQGTNTTSVDLVTGRLAINHSPASGGYPGEITIDTPVSGTTNLVFAEVGQSKWSIRKDPSNKLLLYSNQKNKAFVELDSSTPSDHTLFRSRVSIFRRGQESLNVSLSGISQNVFVQISDESSSWKVGKNSSGNFSIVEPSMNEVITVTPSVSPLFPSVLVKGNFGIRHDNAEISLDSTSPTSGTEPKLVFKKVSNPEWSIYEDFSTNNLVVHNEVGAQRVAEFDRNSGSFRVYGDIYSTFSKESSELINLSGTTVLSAANNFVVNNPSPTNTCVLSQGENSRIVVANQTPTEFRVQPASGQSFSDGSPYVVVSGHNTYMFVLGNGVWNYVNSGGGTSVSAPSFVTTVTAGTGVIVQSSSSPTGIEYKISQSPTVTTVTAGNGIIVQSSSSSSGIEYKISQTPFVTTVTAGNGVFVQSSSSSTGIEYKISVNVSAGGGITTLSSVGVGNLVNVGVSGNELVSRRISGSGDIDVRIDTNGTLLVSANSGLNNAQTTAGTYGLVAGIVGKTLNLKGINVSGNISITDGGNFLEFYVPITTVTGIGEINVQTSGKDYKVSYTGISHVSAGITGVPLAQVSGKEAFIKSIVQGDNVRIIDHGSYVEISAIPGASPVTTTREYVDQSLTNRDPAPNYTHGYHLYFTHDNTYKILKSGIVTVSAAYANATFPTRNSHVKEPTGTLRYNDHTWRLKKIRSFARSFFVIQENGRVYAAGSNSQGELGFGFVGQVDDLSNYMSGPLISLSANDIWSTSIEGDNRATTYILTDDERVLAAGYNGSGQLGDGTTTTPRVNFDFVKINATTQLTNVVQLAACYGNQAAAFAVVSAPSQYKIYGWGNNVDGVLGLGDNSDRLYATEITTIPSSDLLTKPKVVCAGQANNKFAFVVTGNGKLYFSGFNNGQAGIGNTTNYNTFTDVTPSNFTVLNAWAMGGGNGTKCIAWIFGYDTSLNTYMFKGAGANDFGAVGAGPYVTNQLTWTTILSPIASANAVKLAFSFGENARTCFVVITQDDKVYLTGYRGQYFLAPPDDGTGHAYTFGEVAMPSIIGNIVDAYAAGHVTGNNAKFKCFIITDMGEVVTFSMNDAEGTYNWPSKGVRE